MEDSVMSEHKAKARLNQFFLERAEDFSKRYPSSRRPVYIEFRGSRKKITETLEAMGFEKRFDLYSKNAIVGTIDFRQENLKNLKKLLEKGELQTLNPLGILEDF
jgi:hypothetical protein